MNTRIDSFDVRGALLAGLLALSSGNAWALSGGCVYPEAGKAAGTGMGGTGAPAHGSGIGGTGIAPQPKPGQAEVAGSIVFSQGKVEALGEGGARPLAKGAPVCVGETIVTSQASQAQIRMADGGMLSVRPETRLRIDAFHFTGKEDGTERSDIALLEGRFRALTGTIGHTNKENYRITTPGAQIGIRGTDHEPMYIPNPAPGQKAAGAPGTYDKVNSGGVVIRTAQGAVEVQPNQVGFAPNEPSALPVILKEMPRVYRPEAGAEGGFGSPELHGGKEPSGEAGEHAPHPEGSRTPEIRVPEPRSPELKGPDVNIPETQLPGGGGRED